MTGGGGQLGARGRWELGCLVPRIGARGMFALFALFALELTALAAGEGRVLGVRCWVLGMGQIALTPVSSTGQALSHDGRGGRCGGAFAGMTIGSCRGGAPSLYLSPGGGEIGGRVGEAGELVELLEVLADVV